MRNQRLTCTGATAVTMSTLLAKPPLAAEILCVTTYISITPSATLISLGEISYLGGIQAGKIFSQS